MTLTLDSGTSLEHAIVRRMIEHLRNAGWYLQAVGDGEAIHPCSNTAQALEHVFSVMDSTAIFHNGTRGHSVALIVGNDRDIISDHSVSQKDDFNATMEAFMEELENLPDVRILELDQA